MVTTNIFLIKKARSLLHTNAVSTVETKSAPPESVSSANSDLARAAAREATGNATTSELNRLPWRAFGLIAVAVLTFMMSMALVLPPRYVTVDDSFLDCLAAGVAIANTPDSHLPYMNFLVGIMLSTLYSLTEKIPFYPLFLLLGQYISNVVICATMYATYRCRLALVPIALYLVAIATPVMAIFQFSTTSAITGIASGVLAGAGLECGDKRRRNWLFASAVALFLLSTITRPRMGIIVIASFFVVMFSKYAFKKGKKLIHVCVLTAVLVAVQLGLTALNDSYYSNQWSEFGKMCNNMYPIFDWGRANSPDNKAQLESVGWTQNDYRMMRRGLLFDDQIFSSTIFKRLENACPPYRGDWRKEVPINLESVKKDAVVALLLILTLSGGLMLNLHQISPKRILVLLAGSIALTLAIAFMFKLARHAYLPMFYILAVVSLTHLDMRLLKTIPVRSWAAKITTVALALIFCKVFLNFYNVESACNRVEERNTRRFQSIIGFLRANPDKLVFSLHATGILPPQIGSPFETVDALKGLKMVTSFSSRTPRGHEIMQAEGINDFASGLLSPKGVFLSDRRSNRLLKKYFNEHHGLNVKLNGLYVERSSGLGVYRVAAAQRVSE